MTRRDRRRGVTGRPGQGHQLRTASTRSRRSWSRAPGEVARAGVDLDSRSAPTANAAECVNPTGGGDEADEADNECAPDSFARSRPRRRTAGDDPNYSPSGQGGCTENRGRQRQGQPELPERHRPDSRRVAARRRTRRRSRSTRTTRTTWSRARTTTAAVTATATAPTRSTAASSWSDTTVPMSFTHGDAFGTRAPVLAGRRRHVGRLGHEGQRLPLLPGVQPRQRRHAEPRPVERVLRLPLDRQQRRVVELPGPPGRRELNDPTGAGARSSDKQLHDGRQPRRQPVPGPGLRDLDDVRRRRDRRTSTRRTRATTARPSRAPGARERGQPAVPGHLRRAATPQGNCNENQFSHPFIGPDGALYVAYANFNNARRRRNDNRNQMLLAKSTDGGATFSAPGQGRRLLRPARLRHLPGRGADPGRACVPEKGPSTNSVFRATNYPSGAVNPKNPNAGRRDASARTSTSTRTSRTAASPAGFSSATGLNLYTGVKTAGACNNKILVSVSNDGGATFTGGGDRPAQRDDRQPGSPPGDDRPVLAVGGVQRRTASSPSTTTTASTATDETTGCVGLQRSPASQETSSTFGDRRAVTSSSMPPPTQFAAASSSATTSGSRRAGDDAAADLVGHARPRAVPLPGDGRRGTRRSSLQRAYRADRRGGERREQLHGRSSRSRRSRRINARSTGAARAAPSTSCSTAARAGRGRRARQARTSPAARADRRSPRAPSDDRSEYSGCEETIFAKPCSRASSTASRICSPLQFETPMNRALPASTTSVSAPSVSSTGTSSSQEWHW